jgi:hypothetical protein
MSLGWSPQRPGHQQRVGRWRWALGLWWMGVGFHLHILHHFTWFIHYSYIFIKHVQSEIWNRHHLRQSSKSIVLESTRYETLRVSCYGKSSHTRGAMGKLVPDRLCSIQIIQYIMCCVLLCQWPVDKKLSFRTQIWQNAGAWQDSRPISQSLITLLGNVVPCWFADGGATSGFLAVRPIGSNRQLTSHEKWHGPSQFVSRAGWFSTVFLLNVIEYIFPFVEFNFQRVRCQAAWLCINIDHPKTPKMMKMMVNI